MARFDTSGLDDLFAEMAREGELVGETADEMLIAGADIVRDAWRYSALSHGHIDTGDMFDSITYSKEPKTVKDIRNIDIYPQGTDSKGVRNAEKAFITNYGTSKKPGSHWVDDADKMSAEPIKQKFEEIWKNKK